jgi:transcriptional regulator with XRE-family HTH domain
MRCQIIIINEILHQNLARVRFCAPHAEMIKKSPNPIDRHVGSRIRVRRQTLGMSQRKLAGALGLTFQQIQNYENGINRIGAGRLQQLSHVLQVPPAFFFEDAPHVSVGRSRKSVAPSPVQLMRFLATPDGTALAEAFMRLDVKLRWRIVNLVQTITDSGR